MKTFATLIHAALLGAVTVPLLLVPSFAQQEIDPTWHDPWAVTTPTPANAAKPVAAHRAPAKAANTEATLVHKKQVRQQAPMAAAQPKLERTELASK
jgi:hypothetical protein